ncbi:MAG: hypothetical protein WC314_04205 [Vulcanimicrobiota bacterium]
MRLQPRDRDIVWESIEGEVLLLDLFHGVYYSVRFGTAQLVSDLLHGHRPGEVAERWLEKVGPTSGLQEKIQSLSAYLVEHGLAVSGRPEPSEPAAFLELESHELPDIERFEDMKEIFEMDPIHEGDLERGWPVHN